MAKQKKQDSFMEKEISLGALKEYFSREWFIALLLFAFSLALHIAFKNTSLFHFDSAIDTIMVERTIQDWSLNYSYGWGAPAMIVIVGFFYYLDHLITGTMSAEGAYFLVTFVTAALSSSVMYLFVRRFAGRFTAIGSAVFLTITPLYLSATTYPKTHPIAMFFALLSGFLILLAADKKSWKLLAWAGLSAGIAMATRPIDGGFVLIPFALLYLSPRIEKGKLFLNMERVSARNIAAFLAPAVIVLAVLIGPRVVFFGGIGGFLEMMKAEARGGWRGLLNAQTAVSFSYMAATLTYAGWIAVLAGIGYLLKKRRVYILSVLALWFAIMFFYIGNLSVVDSRFLIPAVVPLCILMAYGCKFVYDRHKTAGIAAVILIAALMFASIYPVIKARHDYSGQKEFAEYVAMMTEPNSAVFSGDNYVFIKRYGHREPLFFGRDTESINDILKNILNGTSVYAVESAFPLLTQSEKELLAKYFLIQYIGQAQNEIYQFSALDLRRFDEKLFQIKLNETAFKEGLDSGNITA